MTRTPSRSGERDLVLALLARRFDVARGYLRGGRVDVSPYRSTVADRLSAATGVERAIDRLEADDPIGVYLCLVDAEEEKHPLEPAIFSALGVVLEARGEPVMARAAHLAGIASDDAMRLMCAFLCVTLTMSLPTSMWPSPPGSADEAETRGNQP